MRALRTTLFATLASLAVPLAAPELVAQEQQALSLQNEAKRKFRELHERMQKLQLVKATTEPEQAEVLAAGNRFIQEKDLHDGMEAVRRLIEDGEFDEALERMDGVKEELTALLDLLLNRDLDLQKLLAEIERLEKYKARVDKLVEEQQEEKNDAAETDALEKHLRDLEAAKKKVEDLIEEQKALRAEANESGLSAEPEKAERMAGKEGELEEETEALAKRLESIDKDAKRLGTSKKPAEGKGEPKDGSPGSGGGSGGSSGSAKGAAGSMGKAEQQLQQNKPERSLEDMDRATAQLESALKELEELSDEARRKLLALPFDQQIRAQETTRIDTDRLAQDMEADDSADGQESPQPTPGKSNIQQAVPKQKAAAGQLKDYKPSKAKQDQQDALDDLQQAQQALEDALAQLRQQLTDEVLRSLEERFGAMLAKQKEISARTKAVERVLKAALSSPDTVPAQVARTCGELSGGELELSAEAGDALKLLEEDGRTAAFPMIVEELGEDLSRVADRLAGNRCATMTQGMQADIEDTLKDLIDALRRTIENRAGGT